MVVDDPPPPSGLGWSYAGGILGLNTADEGRFSHVMGRQQVNNEPVSHFLAPLNFVSSIILLSPRPTT